MIRPGSAYALPGSKRRGALFGVTELGGVGERRVAELVVLALAARVGHRFGDDLGASAFAGAAIAA